MGRSYFGKKILKISEGLFASLTDLILVFLVFGYESMIDPRVGRSLKYTFTKMDKRMAEINFQSIKRAIHYAREKGWIKENLEPTDEGQKRLKTIFPSVNYPKNWDGNWYLVNFDIPEKLRRYRNTLRFNLENLNFGKLQASIWISPYNFLGDVKKIVDNLNLTPYVIFSISNKIGEEQSRFLAEKIWKISSLQEQYQQFVYNFERGKQNLIQALFIYQSIALNDPQLPRDLLPEDWIGEEAKKIRLNLLKLQRN